MIETVTFIRPSPGARYDHMLRRFSVDAERIVRLRTLGVAREGARELVERVAGELDVAPPDVTFHAGRGAHTGYCQMPRGRAVALSGEGGVARWERAKRRPWPTNGMIRLGDPTSVGTVAHELSHHLVNALDPLTTPAHGKVWVGRFDDSARVVQQLVMASV